LNAWTWPGNLCASCMYILGIQFFWDMTFTCSAFTVRVLEFRELGILEPYVCPSKRLKPITFSHSVISQKNGALNHTAKLNLCCIKTAQAAPHV
jgi:hypothetical protein